MVQIRQANLEDIPAIKKIDQLAFSKDSYPLFVLRQWFDISSSFFLVAQSENEILGYSLGHLIEDRKYGWILSLGVHPDASGKQIGSLLTMHMLKLFEKSTCDEIYLTVHPANASAIRIYEKSGFTEVDRKEDYYFNKEPRIIMRKSLAT